jgi:hypothetical protein
MSWKMRGDIIARHFLGLAAITFVALLVMILAWAFVSPTIVTRKALTLPLPALAGIMYFVLLIIFAYALNLRFPENKKQIAKISILLALLIVVFFYAVIMILPNPLV